ASPSTSSTMTYSCYTQAEDGIRGIGRAAIEDLVVGGRLVRVRADNGADAAIDEMGETHLLAGGFGVEVYDNGVGLLAQRAVGKLRFDRLEGIVQFRVHEDAAHYVCHQNTRAIASLIDA